MLYCTAMMAGTMKNYFIRVSASFPKFLKADIFFSKSVKFYPQLVPSYKGSWRSYVYADQLTLRINYFVHCAKSATVV